MELFNKKWFKIVLAEACVVIVAVLGSIFVNLGMDWFNLLVKPSQWIPNIVIPIVWTIIYGIVAIILFLWIKADKISKTNVVLLIINGVLNIVWCLFFFTFNLTFVGNIIIILNLFAGILLVLNIYKTKKIYGYLLIIYPVWLAIATSLNLALWILN